jgi:hypothetical protein
VSNLKITGTVKFVDLETGVWLLESDDGKKFVLRGGDRKIKKNGARIEAEGTVDSDSLGVEMSGPLFVVKKYSFL